MKVFKKLKKLIISIGIIIGLFIIMMGAFLIYASNYYHNQDDTYLKSDDLVSYSESEYISYIPKEKSNVGIIIYPGAQVDELAYTYLAHELAINNYNVFLVRFPFKFAFFDMDKANDIINDHSDITDWYLMGHSLGGAMGASYLSKNIDKFKGLILLASYSTADLSSSNLKVLSIYGSNDLVVNKKNYEKYKSNLPSDFIEYVIDGGNHANYATYGNQKGDGESIITRNEQITITVNEIKKFIIGGASDVI